MPTRVTALAATLAFALGAMAPLAAAKAQAVGGFEEAQVEAFAEAVVVIQAINAEYTERMQTADDATQQAALAEEANARAVAAVEEIEAMDVETYNAIADATRADPALAERVNAEIAALME